MKEPDLLLNRQVPRYVDEDVDLQQSVIILQYLAKKHDMYGDTTTARSGVSQRKVIRTLAFSEI